MNRIIYVLALLCAITFVFTQCGSDPDKIASDEYLSIEDSTVDIPEYARYAFPSGVIEMESETMGMKQYITMYIADWGRQTASEIHMNMLGQKVHMLTIEKDGWIYEIDMVARKGVKKQMDSTDYNQLNYLNIDQTEQFQGFEIKKNGQVEFIGKQCEEYSLSNKKQGLEVTVAVWKGFPLRSFAKIMGMTVKINVTKIQENVQVPSEKFEVPSDINFTEKL